MFDELLIHPRTRLQLESFIADPSHGLIITGAYGSGKRRVALEVAAHLLGLDASGALEVYPYFSLTDPADSSIPIDDIRALQGLLKLKTPANNKSIRRVMTIIDAGRMRLEAQNAFLKSLEEPPEDTVIILTADANNDILPTIYSRAQRIEILPVSELQAMEYYKLRGIPAASISRNYALSQGQPGLLHSLLTDESHPLKESVEMAKQLLGKTVPERLVAVDDLSKDKPTVSLLLNAFGRIAHAAITASAIGGNQAAISRWKDTLELIQKSKDALSKNANIKLVLDNLLINL